MRSLAHNLQTSLCTPTSRRSTQPMRLAPVLFLLLALRLTASDLTVVRILPEYRTEASFERIAEFFGGQENTGGQTFLRSRPDSRAGYYFLMRLKNAGAAVVGARIELAYITPGTPDPRSITFPPATVPTGSHVFQLGLTGSDWTDPEAKPVAWRVRVLAADGRELLSDQSFLWGQPSTG